MTDELRDTIYEALSIAASHAAFRADEQEYAPDAATPIRRERAANFRAIERRFDAARKHVRIGLYLPCDHARAEELPGGDKWCPRCGAFGGYCADGIHPREYLWRLPGGTVHHTSYVTPCAFATSATCGARAGSEVSNKLEDVDCGDCRALLERIGGSP